MKKISLLGVLLNIPLVQKKVSGSRSFLYEHLVNKGYVAGIIDPVLTDWQKKYYLIKNFALNKNEWLLKRKY